MDVLSDTGAITDLVTQKYVKSHMCLNEKMWFWALLHDGLFCLPVAKIELDCEMGHVIIKTAVSKNCRF